MTYKQALRYLSDLGSELHGMKFDLETTRELLAALGEPHKDYPAVLIAGTNGKGSTAFFLDSILRAHGIRCGRYTSPQLVRIEERIAVDGLVLSPERFGRSLGRVAQALQNGKLSRPISYFECLTAAAFESFSRSGIELAVLEVGMGGRLDATNVVEPLVSLLTPIGLDHQQWLGDSVGEIAGEKAGIMRSHCPAISAEQDPQAALVFRSFAHRLGTSLLELRREDFRQISHRGGFYRCLYKGIAFKLEVAGAHQLQNAAVACEAARSLRRHGFAIADSDIEKGLAATRIPGRMQKLSHKPDVYIDGAHNPHATRSLADFLRQHTAEPRTLIFSMLADKDLEGVAAILNPLFSEVLLFPLPGERGASPDRLKAVFPGAQTFSDAGQALENAGNAATVVATGSYQTAGAILALIGAQETVASVGNAAPSHS